jgi:hypothetical protein
MQHPRHRKPFSSKITRARAILVHAPRDHRRGKFFPREYAAK